MMNMADILENVRRNSTEFAADRRDRQLRRHLEPADFERLREAGFLLTAVPAQYGGAWQDMSQSIRPTCDILRVLAQGDPSVALVAAMHPAVIHVTGWLTLDQAPSLYTEAWENQRRWVFETARSGAWWGTVASEAGSGGSLKNTRATARKRHPPLGYQITGQKQFGSGSGITSYMITTAIPDGESDPDIFFMDLSGVPWDGTNGITLVGAWDGHGMTATQSHALQFDEFPGTRVAWPGLDDRTAAFTVNAVECFFAAVFVGIVEIALDTARQQLERRRSSMGAYEQVEWTRAELEGWLVQQAYHGMLSEVEAGNAHGPVHGKTAIAELSITLLDRLCRVLGGGAYARHSPFGFWLQDVRALGYLRPPWGLAFETMYDKIPHEPTSETGMALDATRQSAAAPTPAN